jgi:hypothetical protein
MRFKNQHQLTDLWVDLETPDGKLVRVEGASMAQLITKLDIQMRVFQSQGHDYLGPIEKQAKDINESVRGFLSLAIENIICQRQPSPSEVCYSDGIGDRLLIVSGRIDKLVDKISSPSMRRLAETAIKVATRLSTGTSQPRLKSCSVCGGSKSITPKRSIIGRSGRMNRMFKNK